MALDVRVAGSARLHEVAKAIRATGDKGMAREMGRALTRTTLPVQRAIAAEADRTMPESGGYRQVLSKSLRHKTSQRTVGRNATVRLITYADGTGERRDVESLEDGDLRHPVFRRSRRIRRGLRAGTVQANPWAVTKIRAGFHERGTRGAADRAAAELGKVLDDFADRLTRG